MDTNVLVAGLRSKTGAAAEILRLALLGRLTLLASVALFLEYEAVTTREAHLAAAGVTEDDVTNLLDSLAGKVSPIEIQFSWRPQLKDPDDEMVLELAVNGGADAIITFNARHFGISAKAFGIAVLTPKEALIQLQSLSASRGRN